MRQDRMGRNLTADARAALARAGFSRRDFLKGSGALVVGFSIAELSDVLGQVAAQGINGAGASQIDSWVAIAGDGRVTAYTGKCELGQGMLTAQTQLVAEELSVPMERVTLIQCDTAMTPDQGTTSGSQSHPANFNHANLALACATAREALVQMASDRLGEPVTQLIARDGVVSVRTADSRRVTYGELVGGRRFNLPLNANAKRKPSSEWTILGTPAGRVDIPALVVGTAEFVHTLHVPGMLHGRVVRPPAVGATLTSVDESSISGMPGFVKVVRKTNFLGVVFEKPWQAIQGAARLKTVWSSGVTLPPQATFYEYLRKQPARDTLSVNSRDVDAKLQQAAQVIRATYHHPYQMHGSIGSSCAVADVQGDRATIWSSTQSVYPLRSTTAMILGLQPANVRIVFVRGSGCYGINGADTVSFDAALLSQAVGRPVRVQLSRKDEMAWENYGFAYTIDQRAGLDASGAIVAWDYENWYAGMGGRPGANTPGNVITGMLAGFQAQPFTPRTPAPEPTGGYNNGTNVVPSYVTGTIGGVSGGTGTVASQRALTHVSRSYFPTGPLRSPSRLQNTFAHESFMDEIASRAKADPVAYRLRHLKDSRLRDVVNAAARGANWDARPSPKPGIRRTGIATGRGMACVLYEGDNGYAAIVAEVEVNQDTGRVVVKRMVISSDCGPISNPDGLRNQLEGGALQGLSRAMGEAVTWDEHAVTSVDWRTYPTLYVGSALPAIEHVLINRPDGEVMGAGETSITIVAAAVGNALFDATGARLREVPFTQERVKAVLAARP